MATRNRGRKINVPKIQNRLKELRMTARQASIAADLSPETLPKALKRGNMLETKGRQVQKVLGMQDRTFWLKEEEIPEEPAASLEPNTVIWFKTDQNLMDLLGVLAGHHKAMYEAITEYLEPKAYHQVTIDEYAEANQ